MKLKNIIYLILFTILLSGCSLLPSKKTSLTDNTNTIDLSPSPGTIALEPKSPPASMIDVIMAQFQQLSEINTQPTSKSFLYNTKDGEKTINGVGFALSSPDFSLDTLSRINSNMRIYLRDMNFETDMYNAMSGVPGYRVDRLKLNDVCCQLRLTEDVEKGEANLDFSCGMLEDRKENQQPQMSLKEAISIAETSVCVEAGNLNTNDTMYNEISKTWWIDLAVEGNEGCNPACVVSEDKSAEINWRCTGFLGE